MKTSGFKAIFSRSCLQLVRRPLYWIAFFAVPLFTMLFFTNMLSDGIPVRIPSAMVDKDGSHLSRQVTQDLGSMQLVKLTQNLNSYSEARKSMGSGQIYGFFLIPEDFERDLMAGRKPAITFYTNMGYYIPATMLMRAFSTTALFTKAGVALNIAEAAGYDSPDAAALLMPIDAKVRALHNSNTNYGVYLSNSFVPCTLQLMIMLLTCFSLGQEIKYGTSRRLLGMARGSVFRAVAAKLLPQTIVWMVVAFFMQAWLFRYSHYPMNGSWFWISLSTFMFVLASQGMGLFFFGLLPNLRMSLSICALLGIIEFSLSAISMPVQSMYPAVGIFSWIMPFRYYFLIYADQALDGIPIYYSRLWYAAYIIFMVAPLPFMWRIKKEFAKPVYAP